MLADNPAFLIEQGAPRRIHDDEELTAYTKALFRLTAKEHLTSAELDTADLLTLLVEEYESRYRLQKVDPLDLLKYLMQKGELRQQDLREELGSLSNISMILSGQRKLSLRNAGALAERFNMDVRAFLPKGHTARKTSRGANAPRKHASRKAASHAMRLKGANGKAA